MLAEPAGIYAEVLAFLGLREWTLDDFPEHNKKPYSAIDSEHASDSRNASPSRTRASPSCSAATSAGTRECPGTRRSTRKTAWARDSSD